MPGADFTTEIMAKWFSEDEVEGLDPKLVQMLDAARGFAHCPFIITSGYRTQGHNEAIGGVPNSAHTRGLAVDIQCNGSRSRFLMVSALILAGFRRIELAPRHIHADVDPNLPQDVMWFGESH